VITIKNTQRAIPINVNQLKKDIQKLLKITGYEDFDIGLWITTDKTIRTYNKKYRHKDKATTILSFPFHDNLKAGNRIHAKTDDDKNLGDMIISAQSVVKNAPLWSQTFNQRLQGLIVHGFCHLLGYTHTSEAEETKMLKKENELIKNVL